MGFFDKFVGREARLRKHARVFIRRDGASVIGVTMHYNQNGVLCEDRNPVLLESPSDAVLGQCAFAALNATARVVLDLRDAKRSDWPAYIASDEPSIGQFERKFVAVHIAAANEHNLVFEIQGFPEENAELTVTSRISSSATPAELGDRIRRVFLSARDRRL